MNNVPGSTYPETIPHPEWVNELVIYEIATTNFAATRGPETGTFASVAEKLDYLRELGVTGIWLTGHNLADEAHFYNIWTQYATVRPDELDPRLGTEQDFARLIQAAHDRGIRVFLDVITHGVMPNSPLVVEHSEWFREGSWGMTDYDWYGNHPDLDTWWVETWMRYVVEFGVDGFRLDVSMYRPDLWEEIRRRSYASGHPIIIIHENGPEKSGVVDFLQRDIKLKNTTEVLQLGRSNIASMPSTIRTRLINDADRYHVEVNLVDKSLFSTRIENGHGLKIVSVEKQRRAVSSSRTGGVYYDDEIVLTLAGLPQQCEVENVSVISSEGYEWKLHGTVAVDYRAEIIANSPDGLFTVAFPARYTPGSLVSIQLSCHDDGWQGFPANQNPYVAHGSRFLFGYGVLLQPAIPIFMSGEEFDADFVPNPRLSPNLYDHSNPGSGTWLYGSWIHWEQLDDPNRHQMLEDVKGLIAIRRKYSDLIRPLTKGGASTTYLGPVGREDRSAPAPYAFADESRILIVAGNPSDSDDIEIGLTIPWAKLSLPTRRSYHVRDIWHGSDMKTMSAEEINSATWPVRRDKVPRGGVGVWEVTTEDAVRNGVEA